MIKVRMLLYYEFPTGPERNLVDLELCPSCYGTSATEAQARLLRSLSSSGPVLICGRDGTSWTVYRDTLRAFWTWDTGRLNAVPADHAATRELPRSST